MGWRFIDTDDYYWMSTTPPYQTKRDPAERLRLIEAELARVGHSVVSGSVMKWGEELEDSFDLIVFLYLDTAIRLERLEAREMKELGRADSEFRDWAAPYHTGSSNGLSLVKHQEWFSERDCTVLRIEGDFIVQERLERITETMPNSQHCPERQTASGKEGE